MNEIVLKEGEKKTISFTYKDKQTGEALDMTGATFTFCVKLKKSDADCLIKVEDGDFDHSEADKGVVTCPIDVSPLTGGERYVGEIRAVQGDSIDKSDDIELTIVPAVID